MLAAVAADGMTTEQNPRGAGGHHDLTNRPPPPSPSIPNSELHQTDLPSSGRKQRVAEAQAMTQPAKRMPQWLRTDLLVIVVSLAIISIWMWIGS